MNYTKTAILFILAFTFYFEGSAQSQPTTSSKKRFEVNYNKGCSGLNVEITKGVNDIFEEGIERQYDFEYAGSTNPIEQDKIGELTDSPEHIYLQPGNYTVLQIIGKDGAETDFKFDFIEIEVKQIVPPQFDIFTCEDNGVLVEITDEYYDKFRVNFGDGSPPLLIAAEQVTHYYSTQGRYDITVEGIFDNAAENCAQTTQQITTIDNLVAASISQVEVLNASQISVNYSGLAPGVVYQLEMAVGGNNNFRPHGFINSSSNSITVDSLDTRNQFYCFRVTAYNACDQSRNLPSEAVCSISLQGEAANLQNNLSWETAVNTMRGYILNKDGEELSFFDNPATTSFADQNVVCQQEYMYQVLGTTLGGASSISESIPVMAISTDEAPPLTEVAIAIQGEALAISWPDTLESTYFIEKSEGTNGFAPEDTVTSVPYLDNTVLTDIEYCYTVSYQDACGNVSAPSQPVCQLIPSEGVVYFPTAFTPNNDGLNDTFIGQSNFVTDIEWRIFNRWGELMYYSKSLDEGWDGYFHGKLVPEGSYLYKAVFTDHLGEKRSQSGSFMLIYKTLN